MSKNPSLMARAAGVVLRGGAPAAPQELSKIGSTTAMPDRTKGTAPTPQPKLAAGDNRSQIDTYFTKVNAPGDAVPIIYNGERLWARVRLTLETAGPVAVGNSAQITPVLSGRGQLLETGKETEFILAKGTRLYIASTSVNRVKRTIEPLPWLEQIVGMLGKLIGIK